MFGISDLDVGDIDGCWVPVMVLWDELLLVSHNDNDDNNDDDDDNDDTSTCLSGPSPAAEPSVVSH